MELRRLLSLLEEKLDQLDNYRKEIQNKVQELYTEITDEATSLENEIKRESIDTFSSLEKQINELIEKLDDKGDIINTSLIEEAQKELSCEHKFEIEPSKRPASFGGSYKFKYTNLPVTKKRRFNDEDNNEIGLLIDQLREHIKKINESKDTINKSINEICSFRRIKAFNLRNEMLEELEKHYTNEKEHIQEVVTQLKKGIDTQTPEELKELKIKAIRTLVKIQKYSFRGPSKKSLIDYSIDPIKVFSFKWLSFEERKPFNVVASFTNNGKLSLSFTFFDDDEIKALEILHPPFKVTINTWEKNRSKYNTSEKFTKEYIIGKHLYFSESFKPNTTYCLEMRIEQSELCTKWSDETTEFTTHEFKECSWKECPDDASDDRKYIVDENNPRIIHNICKRYCTVTGNITLPPNKVTSWSIKILKLKDKDGYGLHIGVAPFNTDYTTNDNFEKCGWYFDCWDSTLRSGPPHNYDRWPKKLYGPRGCKVGHVRTGDVIGVVMDTTNGELSFVLDGVNLGVAYEGIPLDKPLVPCVVLGDKGDSVELIPSDVKESVDSSAPYNTKAKSITWDTITLTWDAVEGASFYQIEVDGSKSWGASTINIFIKGGLLPETEHNFRVRTVKDNKPGEWSDAVKGRTMEKSFETSSWKECPDNAEDKKKYSLSEKNSRIAINTSDYDCANCTIIGNTHLPPNRVSSWSIKILKSRDNNGNSIYIGVAPFDIDQNKGDSINYGWYFSCYNSKLYSGPHYCVRKEYGSRRKGSGQYVPTGDSVGVVMDTAKGELSFFANGMNYDTAYEGIPLDKPLVPCVILYHKEDSVELII